MTEKNREASRLACPSAGWTQGKSALPRSVKASLLYQAADYLRDRETEALLKGAALLSGEKVACAKRARGAREISRDKVDRCRGVHRCEESATASDKSSLSINITNTH